MVKYILIFLYIYISFESMAKRESQSASSVESMEPLWNAGLILVWCCFDGWLNGECWLDGELDGDLSTKKTYIILRTDIDNDLHTIYRYLISINVYLRILYINTIHINTI